MIQTALLQLHMRPEPGESGCTEGQTYLSLVQEMTATDLSFLACTLPSRSGIHRHQRGLQIVKGSKWLFGLRRLIRQTPSTLLLELPHLHALLLDVPCSRPCIVSSATGRRSTKLASKDRRKGVVLEVHDLREPSSQRLRPRRCGE